MAKDARGWSKPDSADPTRFVLLRHGQTGDSVKHLFSGSTGTDPALTELGHQQARAAAERLRVMLENIRPQAIIASPLQRTQQTAEYAAQVLDLPILTDPLLRECDFGDWEGYTMQEIMGKYPELSQEWMRDPTVVPPNGESIAEVNDRVREFRESATKQWEQQTIVVVSHVTPIKSFIHQGMGNIPQVFYKTYLDLASLSVVDFFQDDSSTVRSINLTGEQLR
ncbi:MAG: histidine phosphatase family protein [Lawsonella sp.]